MPQPKPKPTNAPSGFKAWHLAATIIALGLILRLGLGAVPDHDHARADHKPGPTNPTDQQTHPQPAKAPAGPTGPTARAGRSAGPAPVEVIPFDLQSGVPGQLLTSILQRYLPHSTPDHADDLRDTLPPGQDPRMIVIIPEADEPLF